MLDKTLKAQMLQKGDRLIDIAHHLRGIKHITHAIESDRWQRWLQPLHNSQHDAILLNIEPLFGLNITKSATLPDQLKAAIHGIAKNRETSRYRRSAY